MPLVRIISISDQDNKNVYYECGKEEYSPVIICQTPVFQNREILDYPAPEIATCNHCV
jgi:hypothetical protein